MAQLALEQEVAVVVAIYFYFLTREYLRNGDLPELAVTAVVGADWAEVAAAAVPGLLLVESGHWHPAERLTE